MPSDPFNPLMPLDAATRAMGEAFGSGLVEGLRKITAELEALNESLRHLQRIEVLHTTILRRCDGHRRRQRRLQRQAWKPGL